MDFRITQRGTKQVLSADNTDLLRDHQRDEAEPTSSTGVAPSRRSNYNRRGKYTRNKYAWSRMEVPPKKYHNYDPITGNN